MPSVKKLLLCLSALFLPGCVLSLEPFYTPDLVIDAPRLEGKWRLLDRDGSPVKEDVWVFEGKRVLAYDQRGRWRAFTATYFRAGEATFIDSIPADNDREPTRSEGYHVFHQVPFHMVSRVESIGERLTLYPLTSKPFNELSADQPVASWVVKQEYAILVLNAEPGAWIAFLEKHGRDKSVFTEESKLVFERMKE